MQFLIPCRPNLLSGSKGDRPPLRETLAARKEGKPALLLSLLFFFLPSVCETLQAKPEPDTLVTVGISNGQLLPMYSLDPVVVHGRERTAEERQAYYKLVYNIRRTYPYAVLAKERMDLYKAMRDSLGNRKETRHYLKEQEREIKNDFLEDLKNMTKSQGAILIKLLARQTDTTAYFLLKDFRGGAKAFAYQTMAVFWGYDLKEGYDPHGEDRDIETIVQLIEQERLSTIPPRKTPAMTPKQKKEKRKSKKARTQPSAATGAWQIPNPGNP